jgi:hypothetical protein
VTKQLVFIHGRAQQGKDSIALKAEWVQSFKDGLGISGLSIPIAETDIRFPYYGDTLDDLVSGSEEVADVIVRGTGASQEERDFIRGVLEEVLKKTDITQAEVDAILGAEVVERGALNWEWVQGILRAIDRHVPFGSGISIAAATYDVYQYLCNPVVANRINEGVLQAIRPNVPTVVVSHSLGTVVAYNLLKNTGSELGWDIPLFVTLGSPLGVTKIRQMITPIGHPACAKKWFNAMDERDVVALYPLTKKHFPVTPPIDNKTDVKNPTENRHGISGYLGDSEVARRIHAALI